MIWWVSKLIGSNHLLEMSHLIREILGQLYQVVQYLTQPILINNEAIQPKQPKLHLIQKQILSTTLQIPEHLTQFKGVHLIPVVHLIL